MTESQTQRTLENVCLFCNDELTSQSICKFCGFKFCLEHMSPECHQCIKTRYVEYVKKTDKQPNFSNGKFRVVCNTCGYMSKEPSSIEYAGEELTQHMQMVGCPQNILLEEVTTKIKEDHNDASNSKNEISPVTKSSSNATSNNSYPYRNIFCRGHGKNRLKEVNECILFLKIYFSENFVWGFL